MSGGGVGNILNAIEVDEESKEVKAIAIIAGSNDIKQETDMGEFLWVMNKSNERIKELAKTKTVGIMPPPVTKFSEAEQVVRGELFNEMLQHLSEIPNVHVLQNPVEEYSDDGHPSITETTEIVRHLHGFF